MLLNGPCWSPPTEREGPIPLIKSIEVLRAMVRGDMRNGLTAPPAILENDRVY
jgi:hypothetical protein